MCTFDLQPGIFALHNSFTAGQETGVVGKFVHRILCLGYILTEFPRKMATG